MKYVFKVVANCVLPLLLIGVSGCSNPETPTPFAESGDSLRSSLPSSEFSSPTQPASPKPVPSKPPINYSTTPRDVDDVANLIERTTDTEALLTIENDLSKVIDVLQFNQFQRPVMSGALNHAIMAFQDLYKAVSYKRLYSRNSPEYSQKRLKSYLSQARAAAKMVPALAQQEATQ